MQADRNPLSGTAPGYLFVNRNGYPIDTRLRDNRCIVLVPKVGLPGVGGWGLHTLSIVPLDGDFSTRTLFPSAASRAWGFDNGYHTLDTLTPGMGFWLKFDTAGYLGSSPGIFIDTMTVPVKDGWNLIGGPSCCVSMGDIVVTGTTITSSSFGYGDAGWYTATELCPGEAYWVKVSGDGYLSISCDGIVPAGRAGPGT